MSGKDMSEEQRFAYHAPQPYGRRSLNTTTTNCVGEGTDPLVVVGVPVVVLVAYVQEVLSVSLDEVEVAIVGPAVAVLVLVGAVPLVLGTPADITQKASAA
ncbi:hypothetical protein PENANT_c003G01416 [Penicillium antarcticum]|uniref:Uncharacterized protein n=1 Tax=Penicillium antarcticum TaxID=416450 RepID=A0A1V6QHR8_9EURO|nr:uncharacterized protein N7508_005940 [Penicillium antarcticum]KAJ5306925.1 hypothetical protein N7508_005940 [Penicillium antarcticum]OQD88753.1 hypothetical protein PENANT_c003G01416 [Penicillium antarcticum]